MISVRLSDLDYLTSKPELMILRHLIQIFYRTKSIFILLVLISGILSCTKLHDLKLQNSCRIQTWYRYGSEEDFIDFLSYDFYYNELNNPVKITIPDSIGWHETYQFYYDEHQHLTKYSQIGFHHSLTYNEDGLIVLDTLLIDFAGGETWFEEKIFYDNQKRIIQTIQTLFKADGDDSRLNEPDTTHYRYDNHGNLVIPGVTYASDKVNPFRLNKVFMFVFRNYAKTTHTLLAPLIMNLVCH